MTKLDATHGSRETKSLLDEILHSILNNKDIASKAQDISLADFLQKLESGDIDKTAKFILLGLGISEILDKMKLSDFTALFDKVFSQPLASNDEKEDHLGKQRDLFVTKYRIRERDKLLITKIIEGIPLKQFKAEMNISSSNANKKIRALWKRLGLENREQLIFVAGWLHLISLDLGCLKVDEEK